MHDSLFKDTYFISKDLLKLNNAKNTCLINLKIILYYAYLLNILPLRFWGGFATLGGIQPPSFCNFLTKTTIITKIATNIFYPLTNFLVSNYMT